jgi:hypothetical protein
LTTKDNWSIENAMQVVMRHRKTERTFYKNNTNKDTSITEETLKIHLTDLANIIEDHGDKYLPVFERVHNELKSFQKQNELREFARRISTNKTQL